MIDSWVQHLEAIHAACSASQQVLANMATPTGTSGAAAIAKALDEAQEERAPAVVLVGQYNAGKSTLIHALTGNDVPVSADITTDRATVYRWRGLRLVDTPGVRAGRPDHDVETERWLARADLVLFVITNELFDDVGGNYFRRLAGEQDRSALMMLVVNKLSRERSGLASLEHMRASLLRVTEPRTPEEFRWVAIDAKSKTDADKEEDQQDRHDLLQRSRLDVLAKELERFAHERGVLGRSLTPLGVAIYSLEKARDELVVGSDDVARDYSELLRRRALCLRNTRARVEAASNNLVVRHAAEIGRLSTKLLQLLTPNDLSKPPSDVDIKVALDQAHAALASRTESLTKELEETLGAEAMRANEELRALGDGMLAKALSERVLDIGTPRVDGISVPAGMEKIDPARRKNVSDGLSRLGKGLLRLEKADISKAAHFFGVKFRPWGATKALTRVQTLGKSLGALGPFIAVASHVLDERRRGDAERGFADARRDVREAFEQAAEELRSSSLACVRTILDDVFDEPLKEVDHERERLRADSERRSVEFEAIAGCLANAEKAWRNAAALGGVEARPA